ncbi:hypothetical protein BGX34_007113 [Mortierella sp. NVP85]|nr:hypothetical protein BGX34_007113 [Mortierella sp. NVP85]
MRYFMIVATGSFIYYWLPGLIFPTLGVNSWICLINNDNIVLSQLPGSNSLGIGTIALDWIALSYYVQPLVTPWFAQVNILIGFIMVASKNYPILSPALFREDGTLYNKTEIMTDMVLDQEKYLAYGPVRMDSFFALTYGVGFAGLTATVVHVVLYHGQEMVERWKSVRAENEDIHSRLVRVYPEVPDWRYAVLFVITLALSLVTCLNIVTEYVIGYLLPGYAIANVTFKTYGYIVKVQALTFTSDLKLGHYMKIPPQVMFMAQLVSTTISGLVNLATAMWLVNTRPNICAKAGYPFTCRNTNTFYSASIIRGAIGPARTRMGLFTHLFNGGFLSIPFWFAAAYDLAQVLAATSSMPPVLPYFYSNGLFVGFAFLLRRYRYNWCARYNYLTSAALDSGVAVCGLIIFFAIQSWEGEMPYWWEPRGR